MVHFQPENASTSFKCANCGTMFAVVEHNESECPSCGFKCTENKCKIVDASDEGY
ncbi:MAG: hypothetical protein AB1420_05350 [Bacillota bacterium]